MGKHLRVAYKGAVYHVYSRGNEKRDIFLDDKDKKVFMNYIRKAKEKFNIFIYSYAVMSNHYHILIETPDANISKFMHWLNLKYVQYFRARYKGVGHLMQDDFNSEVVEKDEYLTVLIRYIHLNPVEAKMCETAEQYKWSSHNEYLYDRKNGLCDRDFIYGVLSQGGREKLNAYKVFMQNGHNVVVSDRIHDREGTGSLEFMIVLHDHIAKQKSLSVKEKIHLFIHKKKEKKIEDFISVRVDLDELRTRMFNGKMLLKMYIESCLELYTKEIHSEKYGINRRTLYSCIKKTQDYISNKNELSLDIEKFFENIS